MLYRIEKMDYKKFSTEMSQLASLKRKRFRKKNDTSLLRRNLEKKIFQFHLTKLRIFIFSYLREKEKGYDLKWPQKSLVNYLPTADEVKTIIKSVFMNGIS